MTQTEQSMENMQAMFADGTSHVKGIQIWYYVIPKQRNTKRGLKVF